MRKPSAARSARLRAILQSDPVPAMPKVPDTSRLEDGGIYRVNGRLARYFAEDNTFSYGSAIGQLVFERWELTPGDILEDIDGHKSPRVKFLRF